jgi:transcriptional regulator with XRE-family HTH domain
VGRQVLESRVEAGLERRAVARAAGIDESYLWRIEAGVAHASLEVLVAIAASLGSELGVRLFPAAGPRLLDRFQAPIVETVISRLHPVWTASPELAVPQARGVIDLVLGRRDGATVIACECHSELRRLELVLRRANEKAAALAQLRVGAEVSRLLLLRSTAATRAIAGLFDGTLSAAYPARTSDAVEALVGGAAWPGPAIVWARLEKGRAELLDTPPRGVRIGR